VAVLVIAFVSAISVYIYRINARLRQSAVESKRAEEALHESEEKFRYITENSSDVIWHLDINYCFTYISPADERMRGFTRDEVLGKTVWSLLKPAGIEHVKQVNAQRLADEQNGIKTGTIRYELEQICKDGRWIWTEVNVTAHHDKNGALIGLHGVTRDISDRKQAEEALRESEKRFRELSIVDDLTQLYNSRHFYFQLKIELDRSNRYEQPLTLLLLDLDNFKAFNDTYGHVEGDQVLRRLGRVVKRCLRDTDFAYRYGGEEFTILLPMTTNADGAITAERIRAEFKKENFSPSPGKNVCMTTSIGVAQYRTEEGMKAFVHRVDQLMYQAKRNGKDRIYSEGNQNRILNINN